MAKIVEVYPDFDSAKKQIDARKVFGWHASLEVTDRMVVEVTFTRDDSKKQNAKLKDIEEDFTQCSVAVDYIERYNSHKVDKSKYRAVHPFILVIAIYFMVSFIIQGVVLFGLSYSYRANPAEFVGEGLSININDERVEIIDEDWSYDLNLEELGLSGLFSLFGHTEPTFHLTLEKAMNFCYYYSLLNLAGAVLILIFIIMKKSNSKTYYRAETEYVQNRKDVLNAKIDELNSRMDDLIEMAHNA